MAWRDSRPTLRQLQGRISIRPAWLSTGRKTRLEALPGQDLCELWKSCDALDETYQDWPRSAAAGVRGREQDRGSHICGVQPPGPEHEPARGGRSALLGATRNPEWPLVLPQKAVWGRSLPPSPPTLA